jgi:hypothetical protein
MHWTILAEIVRALAAGVTAIIAAFKFIQELRQKHPPTQLDRPDLEAGYLEETDDQEPDDRLS